MEVQDVIKHLVLHLLRMIVELQIIHLMVHELTTVVLGFQDLSHRLHFHSLVLQVRRVQQVLLGLSGPTGPTGSTRC